MRVKVAQLLAVTMLAIVSWLSASLLFGAQGPERLIVWAIIAWLFVSALAWVARRMTAKVWIYAGLLNLAGLFLSASIFVRIFPARLSLPFESLMAITLLLIPSMALVIAALLLSSGLNPSKERRNPGALEGGGPQAQRKHGGKTAIFALALCSLLLAKALHNFYWFMVWDTTYDSLGYIWLAIPVPAVLFSSVVLFIVLPGRAKSVGLMYLLLIPALIAVSARAQSVEFRQLTEERAGRVSQAIETYYAREGRYPHDLRKLIPWYILSLPEPVIIYGQDWCYDGGNDYYHLGYVYREHWSDSLLTGRIYKTKGEAPDLPGICDEEIATLEKRYPFFREPR